MCSARTKSKGTEDTAGGESGSGGRRFARSMGALDDVRKKAAAQARAIDGAAKSGAKKGFAAAKEGYVGAQGAALKMAQAAGSSGRRLSEAAIDGASALGAFLALPELLKWSESITKSSATIYDKALDASYLRDHLGGGNHRMFDGGHDLFGAWTRCREASDVDSLGEEAAGYVQALWKDGTTLKGLPFATWEHGEYVEFADRMSRLPGVSRQWVYDLASYDVFEVLSAGLGAVGILFALRHEDMDRLSEILGGMGITSLISANPVMGLTVILSTGYAYWSRKRRGEKLQLSADRTLLGAGLAGLSAALFAVLGFPVLFELGIVLVVSQLARKQLLGGRAVRGIIRARIDATGDAAHTVKRLLVEVGSSKAVEIETTTGAEPAV